MNAGRNCDCITKTLEGDLMAKGKKTRIKKRKVVDFIALKKGDEIYVTGGSGPYFVDKKKQKHTFTDRGTYKVFSVEKIGIVATGPCGMCFLYMGKRKRSKLLKNMGNSPHKVSLIQNLEARVKS